MGNRLIIWGAPVVLALSGGCGQGGAAGQAEATLGISSTSVGAEFSSPVPIRNVVVDAAALAADRDYQESRRFSEQLMTESHKAIAKRMALSGEASSQFLAIMKEHGEARLQIEDFMTRTSALTRAERLAAMKDGSVISAEAIEKAKPAYLRQRILATLGQETFARYQELGGALSPSILRAYGSTLRAQTLPADRLVTTGGSR